MWTCSKHQTFIYSWSHGLWPISVSAFVHKTTVIVIQSQWLCNETHSWMVQVLQDILINRHWKKGGQGGQAADNEKYEEDKFKKEA